ncbi:MAG TPA: hypothetical protein VEX18_13815, partial [Polyangiaceae bacterium]|nr:hypothetical protein [Polyangiaceae bacterium]
MNPARGCSTTDPGVTYMYANEGLYPGQSVLSCNGRYRAMLQADGNFVFADLQTNTALWHAQTYGNRADVAVMQSDGNLVIYDIKGDAIWASATNNKPCLKLKLFDTGVLKLYDPAWGTSRGPGPRRGSAAGDRERRRHETDGFS